MFLDDVKKIIVPAYATTYDLVIGGEGIEVGPFIAGQEGEVIIKADSITFTMGWDNNGEPVFPPLTFVGLPSIDSDLVVATIPIDQPPVLKLNGKNEIIVEQGDPYEEPGATAEDDFDGDLTDKIEISGNVDTNTIGT